MDREAAGEAFPGDVGVARLASAVKSGDAEEVRRLAPTVNLAAKGDRNVTLLQFAILTNSLPGFVALLEAGADPHLTGLNGTSAVHSAATSRSLEFLASLEKRGFDPNITAIDGGYGPLTSALLSGNDDHVTTLLRAGADPDQADEVGNTPLHIAGQIGIPRLALRLLEGGANPTLRNVQGKTFDQYLFDRPDLELTPQAREDRERVRQFLDGGDGLNASASR